MLNGNLNAISSSINNEDLTSLVAKQCNNFFPDGNDVLNAVIKDAISTTIDRLQLCFSHISAPYFNNNDQPFFNHLHGDHYSMFLYLLSNTLYKKFNVEAVATKVFLLNKALFGIDAFYAIDLPEIFMFVHPLGTVLGKAKYSNYLVVYQGVTVGATTQLKYPGFQGATILYSNSSIIGDCVVGNNFILGSKASIINYSVENNKTVVGNYPANRLLETNKTIFNSYFKLS